MTQKTNYGILLEFKESQPLLLAAQKAYQAGFRCLDAFTPYPIDGLDKIIGFEEKSIAAISFIGGLIGGVLAFFIQFYSNMIDYPINVGGRPYFSWPSFIPITFELTILCTALSAGIGMLLLNQLPKLWHPVFNHPKFHRASQDRFFLCIQSKDPLYNVQKIHLLFQNSDWISIQEVDFED